MILVVFLAAATPAWASPGEDTGPGAEGKSDPAFADEVVRRRREAQERYKKTREKRREALEEEVARAANRPSGKIVGWRTEEAGPDRAEPAPAPAEEKKGGVPLVPIIGGLVLLFLVARLLFSDRLVLPLRRSG
ncbi:MAG: hypothetical protein ACYTDY_08215 [Planctomycetota bacterium]|jgi:hypothetical protein